MSRSIVFSIALALIPCLSDAVELTTTSFDGITLAGTLHQPDEGVARSVVVFTHGSEPGVRSSEAYLRWARPLVEAGVAVLIFDKRGCGESTGTYVEAPDLELPAADLNAWVNVLAKREDVQSIGVLGWSQGGWVGPLAASKNDEIEFIVSISGPGVSPFEQNVFDKTLRFAATGASETRVDLFEHTLRSVWSYIITGENRETAEQAWAAVIETKWFQDAYQGPPMMDRDRLLTSPRMAHYVPHGSYEPGPVLRSLRIPMLAVFGEADRIVPVQASIAAINDAFVDNDARVDIQIVRDADHGLRVGGRLAAGYPASVVSWVLSTLEDARR